jgi:para-aminobenzoate synthetase component I
LQTNHNANDQLGSLELLAAWRNDQTLVTELETLKQADPAAWHFGGFAYEWKNTLEATLTTKNAPFIAWPDVAFFRAEGLIRVTCENARSYEWQVEVSAEDVDEIATVIEVLMKGERQPDSVWKQLEAPAFRSNFSQSAYEAAVAQVREHIRQGDVYELNLTQCFRAEYTLEDPLAVWLRLQDLSAMPMASVLRLGDKWLLGASPERFLRVEADRSIYAQPIKGTAPRGTTAEEDTQIAQELANSPKQRAENVMIVDLTRNDLHRSCVAGSVSVPKLFEVQSLPRVHQLVSTIRGELRADVNPLDAVANAFPPGSMTGAPKVRAMKLIDSLEGQGRGIYSGAVGYLGPNGTLDLQVVIRSLVYDHQTKHLCYHVGGAIVWDSDPAAEYAESILKAEAIRALWA